MKRVHLICNAHLDPVWLWEWQEGAAEAMSTFRIAADLCEENETFIFNHNEIILYKWVEEYEPALFKRIQKLVKAGKWHIMGGWYLQPDCNMPTGESLVRQSLTGQTYFKEKFGVVPTTAINLDPFGHTRGLVQILKKSGYDSYLICRPGDDTCKLPGDDFVWVGFDGSEVQVHRAYGGYMTGLGKAKGKVEAWMKSHPEQEAGMVLWGIGNHGGGPSRQDLKELKELIKATKDREVFHSTPEQAFAALRPIRKNLPRVERDLNPFAVGCYTSQVRIKQKHRLLENEIYMLEKMMSGGAIQGLLPYAQDEIREAINDLMFAEFHDILPGSSIQPAEEAALRLMDHGLEAVSRLKARTFFALASHQPKAKEGEIPILAFNPHPFPVKGVFECEFQPANQNWKEEFSFPAVYQNGKRIACQAEKEESNLNLDWRKRSVFYAELQPMQMNRFDVQLQVLPKKPEPKLKLKNNKFTFKTNDLEVVVNARTGLVDKFVTKKGTFLKPGAFLPTVIADNEDPWGMTVVSYRKTAGKFKLLNRKDAARFAGTRRKQLEAVHVIEDGDVRTVIEALLGYGDSFICLRYKLPKQGTEIEVEVRAHWNEKSKMLKLSVPTSFEKSNFLGQVAYGAQELPNNGNEAVAQKWLAVTSQKSNQALTCINDGIYGSDFKDGELRISLLRSPAYSGHPIGEREVIPQNRYMPRIDQGERIFNFWFNAGSKNDRLDKIDREALAHNEKPFVLSFFPSGEGKKTLPLARLDDDVIQMTAFKKAEKSGDYIIRLFEPTGKPAKTTLILPALGMRQKLAFGPFEIKTLRVNPKTKAIKEVSLMER
jgi:alpha-mannosidase